MKILLVACCLAVATPAFAESAPADAPVLGADARAWLDLQKNPSAQVAEVQPMPGEIAGQVYQRYVESFKHPIPEQFKRDSFVNSGGGGGGGK